MKKTLHLNLKRKWFDMILSGEKKEEYRQLKVSYISLLFDYKPIIWRFAMSDRSDLLEAIKFEFEPWKCILKKYDTITFSNGYSKNRPQFQIELKNIRVGFGKPILGAIPDTQYFILELGEIISSINCKNENVLSFIDGV